jgi:Bacterial membrane protein N terminal
MSLNDPQWGKRGRSGPPDLDEIWRNVNRRLNELLGRREPDGGDGGGFRSRSAASACSSPWCSSSGWRAASTSSTKAGAAW